MECFNRHRDRWSVLSVIGRYWFQWSVIGTKNLISASLPSKAQVHLINDPKTVPYLQKQIWDDANQHRWGNICYQIVWQLSSCSLKPIDCWPVWPHPLLCIWIMFPALGAHSSKYIVNASYNLTIVLKHLCLIVSVVKDVKLERGRSDTSREHQHSV